MDCPKCWNETAIRNGIKYWKQRYKCKECKCNYTKEYMWKVDFWKKVMALKLYLEWMWFRWIWRVLWVSNVSVLKWIRFFGIIALEIQKNYLSNLTEIKEVELDEMWHFVQKKLENYGYGQVVWNEKQNLLVGLVELVERVDEINFGKLWNE